MPDKAILCYIGGWSHGSLHVYSLAGGLVPGSSGWLIIAVLSMGLQIPSVPSVLSLTPPLRDPCSVQWLAESIYLCICQAPSFLTEGLRCRLHAYCLDVLQHSVNKHIRTVCTFSALDNFIDSPF
jgi:hypothetical protein